ncbi:MAG: hypothetical protein ACREBU_03705 [Nitrososphaera sp.]
MSSGEMISYGYGPMKEIHCECGNLIKYDEIELNCAFPAYGTLNCSKCSRPHRIIIDGSLGNLLGARLS